MEVDGSDSIFLSNWLIFRFHVNFPECINLEVGRDWVQEILKIWSFCTLCEAKSDPSQCRSLVAPTKLGDVALIKNSSDMMRFHVI